VKQLLGQNAQERMNVISLRNRIHQAGKDKQRVKKECTTLLE